MKYQYDLLEPNFTAASIDIQEVSRPRGYRHSFRSGRGKHGFIYVVEGSLLETFSSGERILVERGELIFIPKDSVYSGTYLEKNTQIKIVQFDLVSGELPEYLRAPVKLPLLDAGELIEAFFVPLKNRTQGHPFYWQACFYELLWRLDEGYANLPKKYRRLQAALLELTEHWDRNDAVSHYAALCDMSEVNFRRLFREYVGASPIEYRNDIRLMRAKNKLQSGEYNVSEAAYESGFSNLSFFIRLYKKKYGYTPGKE